MIVILTSEGSWCEPWAKKIKRKLGCLGEKTVLKNHHHQLIGIDEKIDVCLLLGYYSKIPDEILKIPKIFCCFHESYLPKGKGCAPTTWQIIEGKKWIPITLFEVIEEIDAGDIFAQTLVLIHDSDLLCQIRERIGPIYVEMFVDVFKNGFKYKKKQVGESTFYEQRTPKDSEIDITKPIIEQWNLIRVCDNERYPAFFNYLGHKYILKIKYEGEK